MEYVILVIAGIIGIWIGRRLAIRNVGRRLDRTNAQRKLNKQEAKEKILHHLASTRQRSIGNDEVERLLGVSDATATRYLRDLVEEGRLERIGEEGKYVSYRLK